MGLASKLLWRAFGLPTGVLGRIGGKIMAGRDKSDLVGELLDRIAIGPGQSVLEIGVGPGVGVDRAAQRVGDRGHVAGVDPSDVMLEAAARRNAAHIARGVVKLVEAYAARLPFEDAQFDKAFGMNTVQLWPDPVAGLREVHRVLKPSGVLLLSFDGPARKGLVAERVTGQLNEAGFGECEVTEHEGTLVIVARR